MYQQYEPFHSEPQDLQANNGTAGEKNFISPDNRCVDCGASYEEETFKFGNHTSRTFMVATCNCAENYRKKREEEDRLKRIKDGILAEIPRRFKASTFENFIPRTAQQKKAIEAMLADSFGSFFIYGSYGSGKTHLLYSQYRITAEKYGKCCALVRTTHELTKEIQENEIDGTYSPVLAALDRESSGIHLFWDDADKFKVTDYKQEILFDLIDRIYKAEGSLTITSNCTLAELQEKLSPAIVRRIDDICAKVEL